LRAAKADHRKEQQTEKTMTTQRSHPETHPRTTASPAGSYLGRLAAILAGLAAAVLVATPAFARLEPDPGAGYVAPAAVPPPVQVRTIVAGGMPGWQIALIAIGAALVAAAAAIVLDRMLASRRDATATSA
jgi:hypothetical protein